MEPMKTKDIDALAEAMHRNRVRRLEWDGVSIEVDLAPRPVEPMAAGSAAALAATRRAPTREDLIAWATGEELPSEARRREAEEANRRSSEAHTARPVRNPQKGGK